MMTNRPSQSSRRILAQVLTAAGVAFVATASSTSAEKPTQRVGPEVAVGGITVGEHNAQQIRLNAELVEQMPKGVRDIPISIEITEQDRADMDAPAISGTPLVIGVVKAISREVGASGRLGFKGGVIQESKNGGFVWAVTLTSPGAQAIRVHLENFSLPSGAEMYFLNMNGQADGPYIGKGRDGNGDFWTRSIASDTGVIQLRFTEADREKISFLISELGHIAGRGSSQVEKAEDYWPCWDNVDCLIDATCANRGPAEPAKDAVAKMEWIEGQFIYTCTGGLLADTDSGTQIPYFLTANHCFDSSISNLETFFFYTTDSCNGLCPGLWYNPPAPPVSTIGVTVQATGAAGDFTLLTLDEDPPAGTTFLGWNNTEIAYTNGAGLYRISNANFGPQVYSYTEVNSTTGTCGDWPRGERIYSDIITGSTMGGSSGSPVLNSASEVVGQLSGCCGYNCGDECDFADNWTVDGALYYYWDSVSAFLDPDIGCTTPEDCDDGLYCNGAEDCVGGSCVAGSDPCPGQDCDEGSNECVPLVCDNDGTCEAGEDCNNCPNDCISGSGGAVCGNGLCEAGDGEDCRNCSADCNGRTTGAPSGRFCCGATEGCGDSRCNETGWSCTTDPQGTAYCCGDGTCEGAEDATNCAIDCSTGCSVPADCDDGVSCTDDDCVGGACVNTPNDANCSDDGQFCSGTEYCDAAADCSSTGDPCAGDETCNEATDTCDPSTCLPRGAACTTNEECCSLSCHPRKLTCK